MKILAERCAPATGGIKAKTKRTSQIAFDQLEFHLIEI